MFEMAKPRRMSGLSRLTKTMMTFSGELEVCLLNRRGGRGDIGMTLENESYPGGSRFFSIRWIFDQVTLASTPSPIFLNENTGLFSD